jgi:hypothetical protein
VSGEKRKPTDGSPWALFLSFSCRIAIQPVQRRGRIIAEFEFAVGRIFRMLAQIALQGRPPALVAGFLDGALQLAQFSFFAIQDCTKKTTDYTDDTDEII